MERDSTTLSSSKKRIFRFESLRGAFNFFFPFFFFHRRIQQGDDSSVTERRREPRGRFFSLPRESNKLYLAAGHGQVSNGPDRRVAHPLVRVVRGKWGARSRSSVSTTDCAAAPPFQWMHAPRRVFHPVNGLGHCAPAAREANGNIAVSNEGTGLRVIYFSPHPLLITIGTGESKEWRGWSTRRTLFWLDAARRAAAPRQCVTAEWNVILAAFVLSASMNVRRLVRTPCNLNNAVGNNVTYFSFLSLSLSFRFRYFRDGANKQRVLHNCTRDEPCNVP